MEQINVFSETYLLLSKTSSALVYDMGGDTWVLCPTPLLSPPPPPMKKEGKRTKNLKEIWAQVIFFFNAFQIGVRTFLAFQLGEMPYPHVLLCFLLVIWLQASCNSRLTSSYRPYAYDVTEGRPRGVGGQTRHATCTIAKHALRGQTPACLTAELARGAHTDWEGERQCASASKTCARSATSLDPQHGVVVMETWRQCIRSIEFYHLHFPLDTTDIY